MRKYLAFGVGVTAGAVDVRDGGGACEGATDELGSTTFVGSTTGMVSQSPSEFSIVPSGHTHMKFPGVFSQS
jgi:hypothetical protein